MVNCKNYLFFCYLSSNLHNGKINTRGSKKVNTRERIEKGVVAVKTL